MALQWLGSSSTPDVLHYRGCEGASSSKGWSIEYLWKQILLLATFRAWSCSAWPSVSFTKLDLSHGGPAGSSPGIAGFYWV